MKASREAVSFEYEMATSYRRLVARLIDGVLGAFVLLLLSAALAMGVAILVTGDPEGGAAFQTWFLVAFVVVLVAYDALLHWLAGRTVGTMLLGLKVVDVHGGRLGLGKCLLRALAFYLSAVVVIFMIAITASIFGWIFVRGLGQYERFPHDALCGSYVVRLIKGQLKPAEAAAPPRWRAPPLPTWIGCASRG